jgi:hypothetical protein
VFGGEEKWGNSRTRSLTSLHQGGQGEAMGVGTQRAKPRRPATSFCRLVLLRVRV